MVLAPPKPKKEVKTIVIDVLQNHIDQSDRSTVSNCPIAQATRNISSHWLYVGGNNIIIDGEFYCLPQVAREFVLAFDAGRSVCPISFEASVYGS